MASVMSTAGTPPRQPSARPPSAAVSTSCGQNRRATDPCDAEAAAGLVGREQSVRRLGTTRRLRPSWTRAAVRAHIALAHPSPSLFLRNTLPPRTTPTAAAAACWTKCSAATSPLSTSSFDANSRDGQPDASLGTFKRLRRAAGVKAEPFTYASACRVPEGGQGSARAGRTGGARRRRIRLQDSSARSSACTPGAATWTKPHKIRR
jgi:hypothetical protein